MTTPNERRREVVMMIGQLNKLTDSIVERQGMCLSGVGTHIDFKDTRSMHLWLSGAVAVAEWQVYMKERNDGR